MRIKTIKQVMFLLASVLLTGILLCGCGSSGGEVAKKDVASNKKVEIVERISDTEEILNFYADGQMIFAKLYLPEGEGTFPAVILSYGSGGTYTQMSSYAQGLAKDGIAGVVFDYRGVTNGKSEGSVQDLTVLTQAADVQAILEGLGDIPQINDDRIFLWGHSLGGFVSTYVATHNPDKVRGVIALEPSYQLHEQMGELFPNPEDAPDMSYTPFVFGKQFVLDVLSFDIYDAMPEYKNPVVIIRGTKAPSIGAEYGECLDKAAELFPSVEQIPVEGADHSFTGDYRKITMDLTVQFVKDHLE